MISIITIIITVITIITIITIIIIIITIITIITSITIITIITTIIIVIYTEVDNFYLNTLSSLTHYYRFDTSDIQGTSVLNYATGNYDGTLVNGAVVSSSSGSYKVGSSSLSLVSNGVYSTSPFFKITDGITLGSTTTGLSIAFWYVFFF